MANEDMTYVNDTSLDDGFVTDEDAEKELGEDAYNEYTSEDDDDEEFSPAEDLNEEEF